MSTRLFWKFFVASLVLSTIAMASVAWLGRDIPEFRERLFPFAPLWLGGILAVTCWLFARFAKPVATLMQAASQMTKGDFHAPITVTGSDELSQLAENFNDIRMEMASRDAEMRRLSTVLSAMSDGVIALDESQLVQFANEAAGKMLGFAPNEAQGRSLWESVNSNKLQELVVRLMATKQPQEIEFEWGIENQLNLLVNATSFGGGPSPAALLMIYNLSEVRRLEAMRRDFVANVSHELKTPLSSIKAYAETLSGGAIEDADNRGRFVQEIEEQSDRLHQLISDLLSLSRIEQGNQLMEILKVPLAEVVNLCVREQQRAAEKKNIELAVRPSDDQIHVKVDEDGLRQILINLIDNAIKYTPEDGRVTVGWDLAGKDDVQLFIEDTGIGIPEEMQERVFERFFRVDKARSRELGGTGLGLAIVKHLSQSFGGSVNVKSKSGEGSRFTVRLPLAEAIEQS